ncbi:MAG TPA: hypothetical protein VIF82_04870 [Burkholderiaceae bacterium]|jgi:hypothetical protein
MKKIFAVCTVVGSCCLLNQAFAEPADYVHTPDVTYGEREIDFKMGSLKQPNTDRESAASIGFGYGVTQNWFTELYMKYKRENGEGTAFDAYEWENKFQLTDPGKYPIDTGFLLEIERPKDHSEGYEVTFGPLFQTEFGRVQVNTNLLFKRNYQADFSNALQLGYQWQVKYRWLQQFEYGLQGFGEVGRWDKWDARDQQSHRYGPAIFGKIPVGTRKALNYNMAYLIDDSSVTRSNTFRLQVEYEF